MSAEIRRLLDDRLRHIYDIASEGYTATEMDAFDQIRAIAGTTRDDLALLAAPAVPLPSEAVGDLLAYGEEEATNALTRQDRDQYQFWQGWNAALQRLAAPAVPQDEHDLAELARIPERYETPVDHYREMARRFAESRDALKHRCRTLETRLKELEVAAPAPAQEDEPPAPAATSVDWKP